jgi:uncharacterized protein involved in exopolysaccharide biosynthesis
LRNKFNVYPLEDIRQILKGNVRVSVDKKSSFIIIEVDSSDPEFAANLANAYVEELNILIANLSIDTARKQLYYFEDAISKTKEELAKAQAKFKTVKDKTGELSDSMLTENTYIQIGNKELEIKVMKHFLTDKHPDIRRTEAELQELRERLFKTKGDSNSSKMNEASNQIAVEAYREIKTLEMILSGLTSQYKSTAMGIFSNKTIIQQIEIASPPERRTKPKRTMIVVTATFIGIFFGFIAAVILAQMKKNTNNDDFNSKILRFKKAWFYSI